MVQFNGYGCNYHGEQTMAEHPNKHIRAAVEYAVAHCTRLDVVDVWIAGPHLRTFVLPAGNS